MAKPPQYPRGAPFKPPTDAAAAPAPDAARTPELSAGLEAQLRATREQTERLWHWTLVLTCATMTVVIVTVTIGVVLVTRALARQESVAAAPQPAPRVELVRPPDPITTTKLTPPAPPEPAPEPAKTADPTTPAPPQPATPARERSLEAVGGLTASHLYQTYLNLGLLADATENDVYSETEAKRLLTTLSGMMDTVDQQLTRVLETVTDPEDQKRLTRVRQLTTLLRTQARELKAYWDTPEANAAGRKEHETAYHRAREDAWTGIRELLGLMDDE